MSKGFRMYNGRAYPDPEGFTIDPRRTWREDPLLQIKPWHPFILWKYVIYLAVWDHEGVKVRRGKELMVLDRGQLFYSMRYLAEAAGWKKDAIWNELQRWQKEGRVTLEPRHGGTLITVLNYDPYQDIEWYMGTPSAGADRTPPRKGRREGRRETRQGEVTEGLEVRGGLQRLGRHGPRQDRRHRRDTDATNNKSGKTVNPSGRKRQTPTAPPAATWKGIRGLRDCQVWNLAPEEERVRQLLEATHGEAPPADLENWAREQCRALGVEYPHDQYPVDDRTIIAEPGPDDDPEAELRRKLAKLTNSRR